MTRPEEAVWERLRQIPELTALVGDRIYMLILRQHTQLPAVRVHLIDDVPAFHLRGPIGTFPSRVQIDGYTQFRSGVDAYAEAVAIGDAIDGDWTPGSPEPPRGLSGWRGEIGGSPPTMYVGAALPIDRSVTFDAEELQQVRMRFDYIVWWKRILAGS